MWCAECQAKDGRSVATWDIDGYNYINLCLLCLLLAASEVAKSNEVGSSVW